MPLGPVLTPDRTVRPAGTFRRRIGRYERGRLMATCAAAVAFGFAAPILVEAVSPWPAGVTVRHVLSGANCDMARLFGLAPALRGMPGYWPQHDTDGDGMACEPWRRN